MMLPVQRDQHFAVETADGSSIAKGIVESLRREADVVEHQVELICRNRLTNLVFYLAEDNFCLFDTRAGLRAHMQSELPRINSREEITANEWQQQERRRHNSARGDQRHAVMRKK